MYKFVMSTLSTLVTIFTFVINIDGGVGWCINRLIYIVTQYCSRT